jgi:gliding motility-associated-like protein
MHTQVDSTDSLGITGLVVVAKKLNNVCPAVMDTMWIIKTGQNVASISDVSLCATTDLPYTYQGTPLADFETAKFTDLENVVGGGVNQTYNSTSITITNTLLEGGYDVQYDIFNSVSGVNTSDVATITIYQNPSKANAGQDIITCVDKVNLSAVTPTKGNGIWNCNGASLSSNSSNTALLSDLSENQSVACVWTVSNGVCPATKDTVLVTRNPQVTEPNIYFANNLVNEDTIVICIGDGGNLRGETPNASRKEIGVWQTVSGTSVQNVTGNNPLIGNVTASTEGTTRVSWSISSPVQGCSVKTHLFTVISKSPSEARILPIPDTCALADTVMIYTDPIKSDEVGTWSGDKIPKSMSANRWFISGHDVKVGTTEFTWTVTNFVCLPDSDTEELKVLNALKPSIDLNGADTICENGDVQTVALVTNQGANPKFVWQYENDVRDTTTVPNFDFQNLPASGTLKVTMLVNDVCVYPKNASDSFDIKVIRKPRPYIQTPNVLACEDSVINLVAGDSAIGDNIPTVYKWYRNSIFVTDSVFSLEGIEQSGVYQFEAKNTYCEAVTSNKVTADIRKMPLVDAAHNGIDPIAMSIDGSTELSGFYNAENAYWTSKTLRKYIADSTNMLSRLDAPSEEGIHTVELYAFNGPCVAKDTVTVIVNEFCECECDVKAPNVFTIDGDGVNETFKIKDIENCPEALVVIFNRWGVPVYRSREYHLHEWDGGNYPEGVYFYVVQLSKDQKRGEGHSGVIHLLR